MVFMKNEKASTLKPIISKDFKVNIELEFLNLHFDFLYLFFTLFSLLFDVISVIFAMLQQWTPSVIVLPI